MMEFSQFNLDIRQAANGAMALSALLLIAIFTRYCWHNRLPFWRRRMSEEDRRVFLAVASITVLLVGHFFRAFSSWVEFFLIDIGLDASGWTKWAWIWFLISAILVIFGKGLMLHTFTAQKLRLVVLVILLPACVLIPIVIALLAG